MIRNADSVLSGQFDNVLQGDVSIKMLSLEDQNVTLLCINHVTVSLQRTAWLKVAIRIHDLRIHIRVPLKPI